MSSDAIGIGLAFAVSGLLAVIVWLQTRHVRLEGRLLLAAVAVAIPGVATFFSGISHGMVAVHCDPDVEDCASFVARSPGQPFQDAGLALMALAVAIALVALAVLAWRVVADQTGLGKGGLGDPD